MGFVGGGLLASDADPVRIRNNSKLDRNMFDWERSRASYELATSAPHGHLVCKECGDIQEFHDDEISSRQKAVAKERDFELAAQAQILFGRCAKCRVAKGPRAARS